MKSKMIFGLLLSISLLAFTHGGARSVSEHKVYLPVVSRPFTALYNLSAPDCDYGGEIKSIEAVDAYTVKFTLCWPDVAFLSKVAFPAFGIQSAVYLQQTGGGGDLLSKPLGSGPYMLKEWVGGEHLTLIPNPNYWGPAPANSEFIIRWNGDADARLAELQAGTADAIDLPDPEDYAAIQADPDLKLMTRGALDIFYLGLNNTFTPFNNEAVRQALAMAIDKQDIIDKYFPAGSLIAEQFVPPSLKPGYIDGFQWYDYDVDAARQLLAQAGFPDGFATTLYYRNVPRAYLPHADLVAQDVQAQLAEIGVTVTLQEMESGAFISAVNNGQLGMFMLGWVADYSDATNFYDPHFTEVSKFFGDVYPDLANAIHAAGQVADPAIRTTLYSAVAALVKQHVPMVPIAHATNVIAYQASVKEAQASPLSDEMFNLMSMPGQDSLTLIQGSEPISLYCSDETDGPTMRPCIHIFDSLYWYKTGTVELVPAAAGSYTVSTDLKTWTFSLKKNLRFSNGWPMNANDVVRTFVVQWNAADPLHTGDTGTFDYFNFYFGKQLNVP